jgi:cysteine desulfurase
MSSPIYLDNNATTPVDPHVLAAMLPFFGCHFGNSASRSHQYGWIAEEAVETARRQIASIINASASEIVFTSGATESNNLAIKGFAQANRSRGSHIITCNTEHKSVLDTCGALATEGFRITYLPVDGNGCLSVSDVSDAICDDTILVTVMIANNETGTIHPVEQIAKICKDSEVCFHTDATQAVGKIAVDVKALGVPLLSYSGHKMYGPKGIGALYIHKAYRSRLRPIIHGGGHQMGLRSGTLPVPLIVGFGQAAELAAATVDAESNRLGVLRDRLESLVLARVPDAIVNGDRTCRLPGVTSISFPNIDGEELLTAMTEIAVSAGSACTSASAQPSYVLNAMGINNDLAQATLRVSAGRFNTVEEIDAAATFIASIVSKYSRQIGAA